MEITHIMENTKITARTVLFFSDFSFEGSQYGPYEVTDKVYDCVKEDFNDKAYSVKVGSACSLHCWQHQGAAGVYREYKEDQANINELQGLSCFKIVPEENQVVKIRLIDHSGSNSNEYTLFAKIAGSIGVMPEVITTSNDNDYIAVGDMTPEHDMYISVQVRDTDLSSSNYGEFVANGALYFKTDGVEASVDWDASLNYPKNMAVEVKGNNLFNLILDTVNFM